MAGEVCGGRIIRAAKVLAHALEIALDTAPVAQVGTPALPHMRWRLLCAHPWPLPHTCALATLDGCACPRPMLQAGCRWRGCPSSLQQPHLERAYAGVSTRLAGRTPEGG